MKKLIVVMLGCMIAFTVACSNNGGESSDSAANSQEHTRVYILDPVTKEPVDLEKSQWSYVYKQVKYNFNSEKNMKDFKADPEKYIAMLDQ